MTRHLFIILIVLMSGCSSLETSIIAEDYAGDTAIILDTYQLKRTHTQIYHIFSINGTPVKNARDNTSRASSGQGYKTITVGQYRAVPIEPLELSVSGFNFASTLIVGAFSSEKIGAFIEGKLLFIPEKDHVYRVSGIYRDGIPKIWIEDLYGNIVSQVLTVDDKGNSIVVDREVNTERINLLRSEVFYDLEGGESSETVERKLGSPDSVSEIRIGIASRLVGKIYTYQNLGKIEFTLSDGVEYLKKVIPIAIMGDGLAEFRRRINKSNNYELKHLAREYYAFDNLDTAMLDIFAQKAWEEKKSDDSYMVDAVSWLCKSIAKSGNPRYRSVLAAISKEASSSKLKKYAKQALSDLPAEDSDQFIPF